MYGKHIKALLDDKSKYEDFKDIIVGFPEQLLVIKDVDLIEKKKIIIRYNMIILFSKQKHKIINVVI